jgi:hypothetical protein
VLARYGWDRIAAATAAVYEEVLAERAGVVGDVADEPPEGHDEQVDHADDPILGVAR